MVEFNLKNHTNLMIISASVKAITIVLLLFKIVLNKMDFQQKLINHKSK